MRDELDAVFTLDQGEVATFEARGFAHLSGVLSPTVLEYYGERITELTLALDPNRGVALDQRDTYGKAFIQVVNLWLRSHRVREFVFGHRLASIAAQLLGVRGVRLWHDQALYKEAGGGITPWHTDQFYWPMASDRSVTAWIPLQDTPLAMGPVGFAAGSHRFTEGRGLPISDESERALGDTLAGGGFDVVRQPFQLGDVSFHLGWTYHRAEPNTSGTPRKVMTVIYMDADMRLAPPTNPSQELDRLAFCPDIRPGEVIDAPLTPVLWTAG